MKHLIVTIQFMLLAFTANAIEIDGICYYLNNSNYTAVVCQNSLRYSGDIIIPPSVIYDGNPYAVNEIGWGAFWDCVGLTSIDIPNSVTKIEDEAFRGCTNLTSFDIPNSVTYIGGDAFEGCTNLTSIIIPNNVTSIGLYAFSNCPNLESIKVDAANSFYDSRDNCNAIIETNSNKLIVGCKNTVIPSSVTCLGGWAFEGCSNLTSIFIPSGVISISQDAFCACPNIESIKVDPNNPIYDSRDNCNAIIYTASNLLLKGCNNTMIPDNVKAIGLCAFDACSGLTSITIPRSVTSIAESAFGRCVGLSSVKMLSPIPIMIVATSFESREKISLYVPLGARTAYLAADIWKDFKEIIEVEMEQSTVVGDANGDGITTITDITMMVAYIMGMQTNDFIDLNADVNHDGSVTITDITSLTSMILDGYANGDTSKAYLTCPDDRHPHVIDLGLPSGTKWACCNVGANKPEYYGRYYAWGEIEENNVFNDVAYRYSTGVDSDGDGRYDDGEDIIDGTYQDIGSTISGTQYDVAHELWSSCWQMPTFDQFKELLDNCSYTFTSKNGIKGGEFAGPSGGIIFLPAAGYRDCVEIFDFEYLSGGYYWSGTLDVNEIRSAYYLNFWNQCLIGSDDLCRYNGLSVRPVWVEQ